jgi:hypothetical protein
VTAYGDAGLGLLGDPEGVTALRAWLDGVWGDALKGFHKLAESEESA